MIFCFGNNVFEVTSVVNSFKPAKQNHPEQQSKLIDIAIEDQTLLNKTFKNKLEEEKEIAQSANLDECDRPFLFKPEAQEEKDPMAKSNSLSESDTMNYKDIQESVN